MMADKSLEERLSPRQTHGTKALKRAISTLGSRTIDRRTAVGKALAAWRTELLADLGGIDSVSTQELALVEEAVKTKLILDSVDAWLLSQPSLINKRNRSVLPVVRDRQALVSTLRGLLGDLGLKRRARESPSLAEYLRDRSSKSSASSNGSSNTAQTPDNRANDRGCTVPPTVLKGSSPGAGQDGADGPDGDRATLSRPVPRPAGEL